MLGGGEFNGVNDYSFAGARVLVLAGAFADVPDGLRQIGAEVYEAGSGWALARTGKS